MDVRDNLAYDPAHKATVASLQKQLEGIVTAGLVKPMTPPAYPLAVTEAQGAN